MVFKNSPSDHDTWCIQCHEEIHVHLVFTFSVGPSSVVWSKLGPALAFPPMRVRGVEWSRALILVGEVALSAGLISLYWTMHGGLKCCFGIKDEDMLRKAQSHKKLPPLGPPLDKKLTKWRSFDHAASVVKQTSPWNGESSSLEDRLEVKWKGEEPYWRPNGKVRRKCSLQVRTCGAHRCRVPPWREAFAHMIRNQ